MLAVAPSPKRKQAATLRLGARFRFAFAVMLALAAPVAAIAWLAAAELDVRDRDRVDGHLAVLMRSTESDLVREAASAERAARELASERRVQRGLLRSDRSALRSVARANPGTFFVARGDLLAGRRPLDALVRTVTVLGPGGRSIGTVGAAVRFDEAFVAGIRQGGGAAIFVERRGRIAAGPVGRGETIELTAGEPKTVRVDGVVYRALAASLPGGQSRLIVAAPGADLEAAAAARHRNVALAGLATLLALAVAAESLAPILARRLRRRGDREDEEAAELLGSALAATHDRTALLPVVLETMVDATGALGGVVTEGGLEVVRVGEVPPLAEPLRLKLTGRNGDEAVVLLFPAFGGFGDMARRRGERLAAQAAVALENARQHAIARRQAMTDSLTGLANRRRFMEQLTLEVLRAARFGGTLSVVLADLDDFKQVNDRFGHPAGDDVLRAFADVLRGTVRDIDVTGRLGGEEFAVLLPETGAEGATMLARRLRERLEGLSLEAAGSQLPTVTASFGVASSPPSATAEELLAAADAALYRAKHEGKNRVVEAAAL